MTTRSSIPKEAPISPAPPTRPPSRRRAVGWLALVVAAALVVAVIAVLRATGSDTAGPVAPEGAEAGPVPVVRLAGSPSGYPNPFNFQRGTGLTQMHLVYDTLIWKDASGEYLPWLADSWERSDDGLQWRFELRDGVTWQDGQPLTAQDVVFTMDYFAEHTAPAVFGGMPEMEVTAEGDTGVVFDLAKPLATFEDRIAGQLVVLPRHVWEGVENPQALRGPESIMGSGPYVLEEFDEASNSYLYVANEDYFLGVPHVRRIEFVPGQERLVALEQGAVDAVGNIGAQDEAVPEETFQRFQEDPRYGLVTADGEWNRALHFNLSRGFPYDAKEFRQAFAYAIDRQDLLDRILFGRGEVGSTGGLPPTHPFAADGLPTYETDVDRANALLDEIGLVDATGDGLRDLPGGEPFQPAMILEQRFNAKTGELLKEQLRAVGIDIRLAALDPTSFDAAAAEGNFDLNLMGYSGNGGDPDFLRIRLSSQVKSQSFQRIPGFVNERFDELAGKQQATLDVDERMAMLHEMQEIVAEEVPLLVLYLPTRWLFYDEDVFDAWYFTPGAVAGRYPGPINKHALVTGQTVGF